MTPLDVSVEGGYTVCNTSQKVPAMKTQTKLFEGLRENLYWKVTLKMGRFIERHERFGKWLMTP